ncbi:MAG TPA: hypothetical protein VJ817_10700 [Gemmatimonadales bacterium]|nr:hypothetical protein [Gemmatimonadales bacterium]
MPVTARLSKLFYERLGEEVANELVDWFNLVDATYRADLRDLNELNFARFDAKMEQRLGELKARIDGVEARLEAKLDHSIGGLRSELRAELADQRAELLKWMFLFWAGTVVPLAGLILALHQS